MHILFIIISRVQSNERLVKTTTAAVSSTAARVSVLRAIKQDKSRETDESRFYNRQGLLQMLKRGILC